MKLLSVILENYKPIFNGLGCRRIEIDFTNSFKKIVAIVGTNGCGKSSIMRTLQPKADPHNIILDDCIGRKELVYRLDDGGMIKVEFVHGINSRGVRETTKGYVYKYNGYEFENINPNGNISSCDEIVTDIFSLDPSFIFLSQMSAENKGLAYKTPAERKKIVTNILETDKMSAYNTIYKTLSKNSSTCKSMINMLANKLSTIGDNNLLNIEFNRVSAELKLQQDISNELSDSLAVLKSNIQTLDPDGSIYRTEMQLDDELKELDRMIGHILSRQLFGVNYNIDELTSTRDSLMGRQLDLENKVSLVNTVIESHIKQLDDLNRELLDKSSRLNKDFKPEKIKSIKAMIDEHNSKIQMIESYTREIGITKDIGMITREDIVKCVSTIHEILDMIDVFKSNRSYSDIEYIISIISGKSQGVTENHIRTQSEIISSIDQKINTLEKDIAGYKALLSHLEPLKLRPPDCSNDECPFIKKAVDISLMGIDKKLEKAEFEIDKLILSITDEVNKLDMMQERLCTKNDFIRITQFIHQNEYIINLCSKYKFTNENIIGFLTKSTSFERELIDLQSMLEKSNLVVEYKVTKDMISVLTTDLNNAINDGKIYDMVIGDVTRIEEMSKELNRTIKDKMSERDMYYSELKGIVTKLSDVNTKIPAVQELNKRKEERNTKFDELNELRVRNSILQKHIMDARNAEYKINELKTQITKNTGILSDINFKLNLYEDYKNQKAQLEESYTMLETVKKFSSPTTGIQTLFIQIYMNGVLEMTNNLLRTMFDGRFQLLPFVVSENEFRIPCSGNAIDNDDISSMSTSQVSMISMALSFALLYNSSSKYNIPRLDEIDAGLDTYNRGVFIQFLNNILDKLGCEQSFVISHSMEASFGDADLLQLTPDKITYDYNSPIRINMS